VTGVEQSDAQNLTDLAAAFTRFTCWPHPPPCAAAPRPS
jgi:hypothetical protein